MSDRTTVLVTVAVGALGVAVAACGDNAGTEPAGLAPDCNPLGGQGCLLPWPSMAYLRADASTPSGYRLDLPMFPREVSPDGLPSFRTSAHRRSPSRTSPAPCDCATGACD